jgi:uncharacterized membrane protein
MVVVVVMLALLGVESDPTHDAAPFKYNSYSDRISSSV